MATFSYRAMDAQGQEVNGSIEADSVALAISQVRDMGYFPTSVTERRARGVAAAAPGKKKTAGAMQINIKIPGLSGRVKAKELVQFTRQLATLIDAGLPLLRSLTVLSRQQKSGTMKDVLEQVRDAVEKGSSFSEALSKYPKAFSRLFVNMIRAGEAGGALETVLDRLADFAEKQRTLKRKITSAMIYPSLVVTFTIGILIFLLVMVVPTFEAMFADMGAEGELPTITVALVSVSNVVRYHFQYPLIGIAVLIVVYKLIYRTTVGAYWIDKLKLNLPVFGQLVRKMVIARFARTLETLISSGVPILQALLITKDTSGNEVVARAVADVHDSIREGESIAGPLEASGVFPLLVTNMIEVGEETGALDTMLVKIADGYEEEVDAAVAGLTSVLEPIMIIFMGGIVGTIVIAIFLPLIKFGMIVGG